MDPLSPRHDRPLLSLIEANIRPYGVDMYIGGMEGASDIALLRHHGITTVVNCAINLDFNYVDEPLATDGSKVSYGFGHIRYYKLGLVDGPGNPETMFLAGYYMLRGALEQELPERETYPLRQRGNVLLNCRGGRSRSVALAALFLSVSLPERFASLEAALQHVRERRELQQDEWFETPKPVLVAAARRAKEWIGLIEAERNAEAPPEAFASRN